MTNKIPTSVKLAPETRSELEALMKRLGKKLTATIEFCIHHTALSRLTDAEQHKVSVRQAEARVNMLKGR